jgi:hypothetical protein
MVLDAGVTFTSLGDDTVATVAADGVVTGVAAGTVTIRASMSGVHVDVEVTVLDAFAIYRDLNDFFGEPMFGNLDVAAPGGGQVVTATATDPVYEGAASLSVTYNGAQQWGGFAFRFAAEGDPATTVPQDLSAFAGGSLVFRFVADPALGNAVAKIEWVGNNTTELPLASYTPTVEGGFTTYRIPLADFPGIDLTQLTVPFALFNATTPVSAATDAGPGTSEPYAGTLYVDDVYYVAAPTP